MGFGNARSPRPFTAAVDPSEQAVSSAALLAAAELVVLVIGADETLLAALRAALSHNRVFVEDATVERALEAVVVAAPDLVLLAGDAAHDGGRALLSRLTASPVSSVVPIALLGDEPALDARFSAFRHGVTALIPRTATIDAIAEQVAVLAREVPERAGKALGVFSEANLDEFVGTLVNELRSGILSVRSEEGDAALRLVLGSGRPRADDIDAFVQRVRAQIVHAGPLHYTFDERAGGTVRLVDSGAKAERVQGSVARLRVLLADDDPARADLLAQELRARGAVVAITSFAPDATEFARLRPIDPEVLIIGERELEGAGYALVERMKQDTRLRWASLLVVRGDEVSATSLAGPAIDRLTGALALLAEADRGLIDRSELGDAFDVRLEVNGPARCLRALASSKTALKLSVQDARVLVEVDVADDVVMGASARASSGEEWEGAGALAALLRLSSGRVHVAPTALPARTNLMAPVDVALSLAEGAPLGPTPSLSARPASEPPDANMSLPVAPSSVAGAAPRARRAHRQGIRPLVAFALVGLAMLQGLVFALLLKNLFAERDSAAEVGPLPNAAPIAAPTATTPPRSSAFAAPSAALDEPAAEAAASLDESSERAPSCDELLTGIELEGGEPRAAAFEQLKLARRAIVQGKLDEAQRACCKAIRLDPANVNYYLELAQLLLLRRDGAGVAEWARKAVAIDPTSAKAQALLGDGLARIGDNPGARRAWFAAAKLEEPGPAEVRELAGRNLKEAADSLAQRDSARAERFYRRAAVLAPESTAAASGLSTALLRLGEHRAALDWARRVVAIAPGDALAQLTLGDALAELGDIPAARAAFSEAGRLGHPDAGRRLARLARQEGTVPRP